jgi:glutamyl-tRNA synthetase
LLNGSGSLLAEAEEALENVELLTAQAIEDALRGLAEKRDLKPGAAFQPIRFAVTGSRVSPGLFESLELLGREKSVERIRNARAAAA